MDNEKLKKQLRDLCIAADGLATAMHLFYANVSSDILDDNIAQAEKENIRQRNIRSFDEYMSKHHKKPKEQLDDILKNGMPDIQVERDPSFDNVSFQVKKLIDDFYATHDRAERLGIAEHILLVMFGQTPDELNEIMAKEARNFNPVISAIQHGNEEATHHCGQDAACKVGDGNAVVDKPIITGESLEQLVGATVRLFHKPGHKCIDCPYRSKSYGGKCEYKKVELVGGYYLCLADLPNSIVTE